MIADCRHPKTVEDFIKMSPSPKVCPSSSPIFEFQRAFSFPRLVESSHISPLLPEQGKLLRSVSAMLPFAERDPNAADLRFVAV
jgi:hypothetical protein